jgi:hypothetical protein
MGTGGPFPGAKSRPGRDADHVTRSRMSRSYTSSPSNVSVACSGTALTSDFPVMPDREFSKSVYITGKCWLVGWWSFAVKEFWSM